MHVQGNTPLPELDEVERGDAILLADSSVEGEDIASMLRARGFVVFDVALSLLESRVVSEEPRVIILDVDQPGAIERAKRLRELPVGRRAELFCVGDPLRAAELLDVSLSDKVFERPVDVVRLVDRVVHVAHPSGPGFASRGTTPPPMYAPRQSAPPADSIPPISDFPRAQDPLETGSLLDDGIEGGLGLGLGHVRLSPELAQEIFAAEERVRAELDGQLHFPTPSEEADCLVPPDLLIQLDEPLDALEDAEGTGGLAAALALSAASGSSVSVSVAIGTGAISTGSSGTSAPKTGTGIIVPSLALPPPPADDRDGSEPPEAPSAEGTSADLPLSALASAASGVASLPGSTSAVARGGSPALGIRLGELLGLRTDDAKPGSYGRSPAASEAQPRPAPSQAQPSAQLFAPTSAQQPPVESSTQRADELVPYLVDRREDTAAPPAPSNLVIPPTPLGAQALLTATPMSPPVRFQEPRDFGEGRAFDLRTIPPQNAFASFRDPPRPAPPPSREAQPQAHARGEGDPSGISPAAASVRSATARDVVRDPVATGSVFGEREGLRPLARAVAARSSGALAVSAGEGTRRVVFSDGDIVTAASEIADESLVAFLAGRGDIDRDVAARLAGKLPPSGRHAGAALIAQSHLTQDDLWPVLRAHAEWLLGRVLQCGPGSVEFEEDPPGRLKAEPNVFGGATGAEVFVESARRMLAPQDCLVALGGHGARVDWGPRQTLLAECTLSADEEALVRGSAGKTLQELSPDGVMLPVLRALVELEVLTAIAPARAAEPRPSRGPDPLDEEAVRQKVRAKLSLVRDGDYFALLGVNRDATSYEVRRAFLELRKGFEPARLLTPATVDLHDDVVLILEVVEEAFEILREPQRRDRYRRAIEAGPPI